MSVSSLVFYLYSPSQPTAERAQTVFPRRTTSAHRGKLHLVSMFFSTTSPLCTSLSPISATYGISLRLANFILGLIPRSSQYKWRSAPRRAVQNGFKPVHTGAEHLFSIAGARCARSPPHWSPNADKVQNPGSRVPGHRQRKKRLPHLLQAV